MLRLEKQLSEEPILPSRQAPDQCPTIIHWSIEYQKSSRLIAHEILHNLTLHKAPKVSNRHDFIILI